MTEADVTRFWSKVDRRGPEECWEWKCGRGDFGYGAFSIKHRNRGAHRVAWVLSNGPIPRGMWVCHSCDNPPCCNPAHLFLGTHQDNEDDKTAKGRRPTGDAHYSRTNPERLARGDRNGRRLYPERYPTGDRHPYRLRPETVPRGERHGRAKLTEQDVTSIREMYSSRPRPTQKDIAARFGISISTVSDIVNRKRWAHV